MNEPLLAKPVPADSQTSGAAPFEPASERDEIALIAYGYWEARGRSGGSPEQDWARAEEEFYRRRQPQMR